MIEEPVSPDAAGGPNAPIEGLRITGLKVAYYFICRTKLWLFSHNIQLENEHENVNIGRVLHEERYKRNRKGEVIDNIISVDFVKKGNVLELHEIKKSDKMEDAHRWQMLYYLYYMRMRGVEARGVINYPLLNKKEDVVLDDGACADLERICSEIVKITEGRMPQPVQRKMCGKCAYAEFCFGDVDFEGAEGGRQ